MFPGLTLKCSAYLKKNMDVGNCLKLRAYARRYHLQELMKASRQIIARNLVAVAQQDDFIELGLDEVTNIISIKKDAVNNNCIYKNNNLMLTIPPTLDVFLQITNFREICYSRYCFTKNLF